MEASQDGELTANSVPKSRNHEIPLTKASILGRMKYISKKIFYSG
jgi:hypothetical protein